MIEAEPYTGVEDERGRARIDRMSHELPVQWLVQPDDVTCGPTCLKKVYAYYGVRVDLEDIVDSLERNEDGGTLAVFLGISALRRGFRARIYSYDQRIFDPTWFELDPAALVAKIHARMPHLRDAKRLSAAVAYVHFLEMGGELCFDELTPGLLKRIVDRDHPILAGLSATYLYRDPREHWDPVTQTPVDDDVRGDPTGHFVVINGYHQWGRRFTILDPFEDVPARVGEKVLVDAFRLTNAILLGDVTYDAVLLEVWPAREAA